MMPLVPGAEHYKEIAGKLREVGLRKGRSDAFITEFARDSLLEQDGFEPSVPLLSVDLAESCVRQVQQIGHG